MRIGMLADVYKPHVSGITQSISLTKRALEQLGHHVFVFTFGDLDYQDEETGVIRSPGVPLAETGYYFGFRYASAARRKLEAMDIVHVHHPFLSGRLALRYCRPLNIPVVFTNHTRYDLYAQAYLPGLPEQLGTTFLQAYLPSFCDAVDLVIAPSEGLREILQGLGVRAAIEVLPNGVDLAPFREKVTPLSHAELSIPEEDVVLIYVGRLGPEKNLVSLVRAFGGAHAAYPNTSLVLVGDGPERDNLEHLVERNGLTDKVVFCGMVDYARLPRYLSAADLFVTASVTEVHPLSVIEAMAAGLPVLGIRSPGIEDMVVDGQTGVLSADDLPSFTAQMARLVAEGETRRAMSDRARLDAERFAIEKTSARLVDRYAQLLAQRQPVRGRRWQILWRRLLDRRP
jgi:1,2-diacylglycerol 3-alpha-glucosyltransferase